MARNRDLSANSILIALLLAIICVLLVNFLGRNVMIGLAVILFAGLLAKNYLSLPMPTYDGVRLSIEMSMVVVFGYLFVYGSGQMLAAFNPSITMHEPLFQLETSLFTAFGFFFLGFIGFLLSVPFIPDIVSKLLTGEWVMDRYKYFRWLNS